MATTRLGYTILEFRHSYFKDYVNKMKIYKKLFNHEKLSIYDVKNEMPQKIASLADL